MLVKLPGKDTASVVTALSQHVRTLPATLRRSLTWDRGMELAQRKHLTIATKVQVYFCDPQSPWQRGTLHITFPGGRSVSLWTRRDSAQRLAEAEPTTARCEKVKYWQVRGSFLFNSLCAVGPKWS